MRSFWLIIFLLFCSSLGLCQEIKDIHKVTKKVNVNGWDIPDIVQYETIGKTVFTVNNISLTKAEVQLPKRKPFINIYQDQYCEFRRLWSYTFKTNKVFSVAGDCVIFVFKGSSRLYMGAMTSYLFLDNDGDGKFETRFNHGLGDTTLNMILTDNLEKRIN